jgi:hypothetical protein
MHGSPSGWENRIPCQPLGVLNGRAFRRRATPGQLANSSLEGVEFYGFRFKVPKRAAQEDLVWAFGQTKYALDWQVLARTGESPKFGDYFHEPRAAYPGVGPNLAPTLGDQVVLQHLPGKSLEDEKEYAIRFAFPGQKPLKASVAFAFGNLQGPEVTREAIEKALGLQRR